MTVAGEADGQGDVLNTDAVVLIVSRPQTSLRLKVQRYRREVGLRSPECTSQSVGDSDPMTLAPALGSPATLRNFPLLTLLNVRAFPAWVGIHCGGGQDQMRGGEIEGVSAGHTFWLSPSLGL